MKILRAPIPKTREPFINTPLVPLGDGRFWISSVNRTCGALGVVVTGTGQHRLYKFAPRHATFYGAAAESPETLWLCGDSSRVVRLDLRTGNYAEFSTGAPEYLIFQGLAVDHATGKLFGAAATGAFVFDFRARQPVKVYPPPGGARYSRFNVANGDGTYSIGMEIPEAAVLRWDPVAETVEYQKVTTLQGRALGLEKLPEREMTWFAKRGANVWGIAAPSTVHVWDRDTGQIRALLSLPDSSEHNLALADDKLIAVTRYGEFRRYDALTGALEISKPLPTDAVGHVDCVCRIDKDRLLGTPFITQRFWEVNLRTKRGRDCGKAAPGGGWDQTGRTIEAVLKANKQIGNAQVTNVPGAGGAVGLPQFVNQWKGRQNSVMVAGMVMVGALIANKSPVNLTQTVPLARLTGEFEVMRL